MGLPLPAQSSCDAGLLLAPLLLAPALPYPQLMPSSLRVPRRPWTPTCRTTGEVCGGGAEGPLRPGFVCQRGCTLVCRAAGCGWLRLVAGSSLSVWLLAKFIVHGRLRRRGGEVHLGPFGPLRRADVCCCYNIQWTQTPGNMRMSC